jgi:enterochelin esterase-like enzyme
MRRLRLTAALLAGAAAVGVSVSPARSTTRTLDASFASHALGGELHFEVYLPAGYDSSGRRYPVVYFLHGLPASATSYRSMRFVERALDQVGLPAILVVPQGARPGESDPEYVDHGPGDDWGDAIALELPRVIDARFRTIASRGGRALIGLSAGGYGAMHLALKHPSTFSVVESWSGYFHPTDPTGTKPISLGSASRDARADVHEQLAAAGSRLRAQKTYIAFYVGRSDRRFAAENEQLDRELTRARVPHVFRVFPGGHSQQLWQARAPAWLRLALEHLAPTG